MMHNTSNHNQSNSLTSSSLSSLLFRQNYIVEDSDYEEPLIKSTCSNNCNAIFTNDFEFDDDDYIKTLLQREISSSSLAKSPSINEKCSRDRSINYFLHTGAMLGFELQTTYLSICYFDIFISKISIDKDKSWAIHLLSVACLLVAAKMEENRVPNISDIQVGSYKFECKFIQRMELLLLDTLEWKMAIVTPFAYLPWFIKTFSKKSCFQDTCSIIIKLILAFIRENNSMDHRSYAIASASVLVALDPNMSREEILLKINNITFSKFLDEEDIFTCYNIMLQLEKHDMKALNVPSSPELSLIEVLHDCRATSSKCLNKKSLIFEDRQ